MALGDTIAAIATAAGPAAVGVVRLSGPEALAIADALFYTSGRRRPEVPLAERPSHQIHPGWLATPAGRWLDRALVLVMRGPRSYTGEDVVELQTHGGASVPHAVLEAVLALGARLAAPGEFTKRAFLNGKLDMAQAEAVHDLVTARGERALAAALGQLDGALSREVAAARGQILAALARVEAAIDYPDEIEDLASGELDALVAGPLAAIEQRLASAHTGQVFREGASLVIVGRPNVGKSSLLNALLGHARAIVTDVPGTTRDALEEGLALAGVPFRVVDTAGIRETPDVVEALGVERSRALAATADVVLFVVDAVAGLTPEDLALRAVLGDRPLVCVANKADLLGGDRREASGPEHRPVPSEALPVSALHGHGLDALTTRVVELALGMPLAAVPPTTLAARHRAALEVGRAALLRAREAAAAGLPADCVAIDLSAAAHALAEVTGDALAEEVIEQVFARFCVGK